MEGCLGDRKGWPPHAPPAGMVWEWDSGEEKYIIYFLIHGLVLITAARLSP
jgi:hypothetical protein